MTPQLELRIENEKYFRQHQELAAMVQLFIYKVLDDRPENILAYAGSFFDRAELHEVVQKSIEENQAQEQRIKYLNDLIKGKTLIEWLIIKSTMGIFNSNHSQTPDVTSTTPLQEAPSPTSLKLIRLNTLPEKYHSQTSKQQQIIKLKQTESIER